MKSQAAAPKADPNAAAASKIDLTWAVEGQSVWVMLPEDDPSGEACSKGTIVKLIDDENAQIQVEGVKEPKNYKGDKIYPLNNYKDYPDGYDDMVDMENLSEAELLNNLRIRFAQDMIYTYVGPTLIVANPYKRIEKLLRPDILSNFHKRLLAGNFEQKENMPHVYAISATTMRNMFENYKNQAIVISGESGAGKTENTKSAMKFLTSLGKSEAESNSSNTENIEDKILACNPILEAFGNAKTVRNDNSSRFGKYVALLVDKDNRKIVGATITNYLLEKSRVVGQVPEERNYHIFYALLRGAPEELLKRLFVTNNLDDWAYTKNAFKGEVKTVPDLELYQEVTESFRTMKFSDEEQNAVWTYTAAALMVGNLDFDESSFSDTTPCKFKNEQVLRNAVKILNIDFDQFAKAIRFRTRVVAGSAIDSTMKKDECLVIRDSLAKELYNKLFNWLVKRLNYTVMPSEFTQGGLDTVALMNKYYHIGLLDIFGFEIFNFNSIEQFCINFSNEKLQQLYIAYVFKGEEKEFINEGLKEFLGELNFKDNQGLIDMLDHNKLPGIFQMIDESCTVATTDQGLYDKIVKQFKKPEFPFATPKLARDTFIVKHTAKEVEYNINGFRAKNKDEISKTIEDAVCASKTREIANVWKCLCLDEKEPEEKAKPNPKDKFLGYKFRMQMKELMDELNSCECHFIRCIKPNEVKKADFFLPQLVLQQIKYMGILDTIKVRKDSFPIRSPYKFFYEKYQELDKKASKTPFAKHVENGADFKEMTKAICNAKVPHLGSKMLLYGNTKLFLRVEAAKEIEKIRRDWENFKKLCAKKIQRAWYRYKQLKVLRAMFGGVRLAQKLYRIKREHQLFGKKRRMARRIQKWWKNILWKRKAERIKKFVMLIQKWWKMEFYRAKYLKIVDGSKTINRLIRGGKARKTARGLRVSNMIIEEILQRGVELLMARVRIAAAIIIQKHARGYICRQRMKEEIERIKKAKEDFVKNKNATIIQKHVRGFIVRSSFNRLYNAAVFIQGYMKMRWLSTLFQRLRNVSIKIQKAVKKWYLRRRAINEKTKHYMNTEGKAYQSLQIAEQVNFFGIHNISKIGKPNAREQLLASKMNGNSQQPNESMMNTTQAAHHNASQRSYLMSETLKTQSIDAVQYESYLQGDETLLDLQQNSTLNTPREFDPYGAKKIQIFTKLIDVDVMSDTSLLYDPLWSLQVLHLQNDCNAAGTDIQVIEVGQAHTTVVPSTGKLYSFGWNDYFQLGRPTQPDEHISSCSQISLPVENFRPKAIASGDDHNLVLDYQGNLYIWGDNSKGQLGLGHCRQTNRITILDFLSNDSLQEIRAKGNNSLVVTQTGKVFAWPIQLSSGEKIYRPAELCLPPKITISTTACGYNFAVLVAKNGQVFTFGRDNQFGQLGHGDTEPRDTPTLVETLKNENELVTSVSCGFKHVVCKTKLGRVYTWGWGAKGQLGHNDFENLAKPKMVNFSQNGSKAKVLQAQAGFKHCVVVLDNKKVMWWGSNASLDCQPSPIEINLQKKIPGYHKDFTPIKLLCSWSKTINVTYLTMADSRCCDQAPAVKQKIITTLTNKIEETCGLNNIDLPYIDSISKHFSSRVMKNVPKDVKPAKPQISPRKTGGNTSPSHNSRGDGMPQYLDSLARIRNSPRGKDSTTMQSFSLRSPQSNNHNVSQSFSLRSPKAFNNSISLGSRGSFASPKGSSLYGKSERERSMEKMNNVMMSSPGKSKTMGYRSGSKEKISPLKSGSKTMPAGQMSSLNHKLNEIKKKMQEIMSTPMEKWSKTDSEFMKMATEDEMLELLQNL